MISSDEAVCHIYKAGLIKIFSDLDLQLIDVHRLAEPGRPGCWSPHFFDGAQKIGEVTGVFTFVI